MDGAAEEQDVQAAGEHAAGVGAGALLGGEGYLQGKLLGVGAPGGAAGVGGCHFGVSLPVLLLL